MSLFSRKVALKVLVGLPRRHAGYGTFTISGKISGQR